MVNTLRLIIIDPGGSLLAQKSKPMDKIKELIVSFPMAQMAPQSDSVCKSYVGSIFFVKLHKGQSQKVYFHVASCTTNVEGYIMTGC